MIEQLKKGIKILKYAYGLVGCSWMAGIFLVLGVLMGCLGIRFASSSSMMIIVAGMWVMQLYYSFGVSKLIKTSSWAKKIETSMSVIVNLVSTLFCYGICLVIKNCWLSVADEVQVAYMSIELMLLGLFGAVLMISMSTAYKYFAGTMMLVFLGTLVGSGIIDIVKESGLTITFGIPFWMAAVIGVLEIVLGAVPQYGVAVLLYKKQPSKWAQLHGLSKLM